MTRSDSGADTAPVTYAVRALDLHTVQRLLHTLSSRQHAVTRFLAERADGDSWAVTLDCPPDGHDPQLLQARLSRPPTVLSVEVVATSLPPTAEPVAGRAA